MSQRSAFLGAIPNTLRDELLQAFDDVLRNFSTNHWEPSELNGGKFSEVVYSILRGHVDGAYPAHAKKPQRFDQACRNLEQTDSSKFPRSVRVHIPRVLIPLYEVRNNRGVGHVGGDVDPNRMDATWVVSSVKWVMAELVRLFHAVGVDEATKFVDALTDRTIPAIWEVDGRRRVLHVDLRMRDKALLLLHGRPDAVAETELVRDCEHSNASVFRRDVLKKLHKEGMIHYDQSTGKVFISPVGSRFVEENLPLTI